MSQSPGSILTVNCRTWALCIPVSLLWHLTLLDSELPENAYSAAAPECLVLGSAGTCLKTCFRHCGSGAGNYINEAYRMWQFLGLFTDMLAGCAFLIFIQSYHVFDDCRNIWLVLTTRYRLLQRNVWLQRRTGALPGLSTEPCK